MPGALVSTRSVHEGIGGAFGCEWTMAPCRVYSRFMPVSAEETSVGSIVSRQGDESVFRPSPVSAPESAIRPRSIEHPAVLSFTGVDLEQLRCPERQVQCEPGSRI